MPRMPPANCSKMWRSNFHWNPPSTGFSDCSATCAITYVEVVVLRRHRAEPGHRLVHGGVGAGGAEGLLEPVRLDLGVRLGDRRVADDHAAQAVGVERGGGDRDEAAHAVADDHGVSCEAGRVRHGDDLVGPLLDRVDVAVVAVAVTGQVERDHPEVLGERRRQVGPPMGVGPAAVDEHEPRSAGLAPGQVVDARAADLDVLVRVRHRQRAAEPRGSVVRRHSAGSSTNTGICRSVLAW